MDTMTTTTKTYYKSATRDESILGIRKETRPRLLSLLIVGDSQKHNLFEWLTDGFCFGFVYLKFACVIALGEESEFSSGRATEATAKVGTEAETWRSWVVWSMMMI